MVVLPSGTVSLLFSDVEGSTLLLGRLGAAYADALDGQRRVLRAAWVGHGGVELGTEGDSFFVVFETAEAAVAAAVQAQRELATYRWPGGERVRVRMGVHTGTPVLHDGGYVGMDVHRAARIAGAAHGGQVVISSATRELVTSCLPEGVGLKDLGSHNLKDIPMPERLYQLVVDGLKVEFPPVKTLGASSSLPRPATSLVGRDGELAELTSLMRAPAVRLVTLTGPGGSGKTRLAIGCAERLKEQFPDGVYFVPLAAVTTADVMWTSIAEALNLPPEGRVRPGFFDHVAHRSVLFVLDNLEQVPGADGVVADLLNAALHVKVIVTSRRPLHVAGEHEHPVPPLELPDGTGRRQATSSGAVQMFVQHARMVRPGFALTDNNAAAVVEVCRRLDGLPLAIELAAARAKLLSPSALLGRLGTALDIAASGNQTPTRQKTLRDTIDWSYELLTPDQRVLFRLLGVFAGGADLDAVSAVADGSGQNADPFDTVADLVDASLVSVGEDTRNEPRIAMLETVRAFATDLLTARGEWNTVRASHARHFQRVAEELRLLVSTDRHMEAQARFESEHDNFRQALGWALAADHDGTFETFDRVRTGLRLCGELTYFWESGAYLLEAEQWLSRAIQMAAGADTPELARCLAQKSEILSMAGDPERALECATSSVDMWRRLDDTSGLWYALLLLADAEGQRGQAAAARPLFEEALAVARESADLVRIENILLYFGKFEVSERDYLRASELYSEALNSARSLGDVAGVAAIECSMARILLLTGKAGDASKQMRDLIPQALEINEAWILIDTAEGYAAALAEVGDPHQAVRLIGAANAMRERLGMPRDRFGQADMAGLMAKTGAALTLEEYDDAYQTGHDTRVEDALTAAHYAYTT